VDLISKSMVNVSIEFVPMGYIAKPENDFEK